MKRTRSTPSQHLKIHSQPWKLNSKKFCWVQTLPSSHFLLNTNNLTTATTTYSATCKMMPEHLLTFRYSNSLSLLHFAFPSGCRKEKKISDIISASLLSIHTASRGSILTAVSGLGFIPPVYSLQHISISISMHIVTEVRC